MKQHLIDIVLPDPVNELIELIIRRDFTVTLVGGATRDFLLSGTVAKDFDFELTGPASLEEESWLSCIGELARNLATRRDLKVELTPKFHVIKVTRGDYSIEFAPARVESYSRDQQEFKHTDVRLTFIPSLTVKESFKRRDFTCNAIGLTYQVCPKGTIVKTVVDPFNGHRDLEQKLLSPCSSDFIYDPVRYLRAVRFHLSLGFAFSPPLEDYLGRMTLRTVTTHYYLYEGLKVDFFSFNDKLFNYADLFDTPLNSQLANCRFLVHYRGLGSELKSTRSIVEFLIKQKEKLVNIEYFAQLVQIKKKVLKSLLKGATLP